MVAVIVIPISLTLMFWPGLILSVWTGKEHSETTELVVRLYALGNLLSGFMIPIGAIQVAIGRLKLYIAGLVLSLFVFVPITIFLVSEYRAVGAGIGWVVQTSVLIIVWPALVHRYLKVTENKRWYFQDFLLSNLYLMSL